MASHYNQEYFFQHLFTSITLTDLNEIIHPNAENIPEYIRHFASAMFVMKSFWHNSNAIIKELQLEGNLDDYIHTYIRYVNMLQTRYNLVIRSKIFFAFFSNILFIYIDICTNHQFGDFSHSGEEQ